MKKKKKSIFAIVYFSKLISNCSMTLLSLSLFLFNGVGFFFLILTSPPYSVVQYLFALCTTWRTAIQNTSHIKLVSSKKLPLLLLKLLKCISGNLCHKYHDRNVYQSVKGGHLMPKKSSVKT